MQVRYSFVRLITYNTLVQTKLKTDTLFRSYRVLKKCIIFLDDINNQEKRARERSGRSPSVGACRIVCSISSW